MVPMKVTVTITELGDREGMVFVKATGVITEPEDSEDTQRMEDTVDTSITLIDVYPEDL
jgi:hypothetical protein